MIFEARLERSHATSLPAWGQSFCIDHHFRAGRVSISTGCNRRLQEASLNLVSIQTPEYERIPENDVSRDPCSEVELFMISDDSYLKRHKRYKKLEKGERLRQREKLQHLYYKLNERIKQLRSMDISEFEGAPASMFPSTPSGVHDAAKIISLGKFSGTSYHSEGERRREEMLSTAQTLANRLGAYLTESGRKKSSILPDQNQMLVPVDSSSPVGLLSHSCLRASAY
ncbi:hypothetical protein R3P38DRAFT_2811614 [Favolaschia claudopus]|uniref:Uncharacterized protein n=1 Tax=Favolaschia claudopus TaxID=2862362 RepID=A0AAV9Z9U4_9AGAR